MSGMTPRLTCEELEGAGAVLGRSDRGGSTTQVRLIGFGKVKDYEAGVAAMSRVAAVASDTEGVAVWEDLADETSGMACLNEAFASEDALMAYEVAVDEAGLRAEVAASKELERFFTLSLLERHFSAQLESLGAIQATLVASK